MSTPFPGYSGPVAGTEAPLEMLAACHIRIEKQCATLLRLTDHLKKNGSDSQARKAATAIMRYFDTAAIDHHADEETDLFPALLESMAGSDAVCIREITDGLIEDHRKLERSWRRLRLTLEKVVAGENVLLNADTVVAFTSLYAEHIQREEDELLPMAARLLGVTELDAIGRAMRERRGIEAV
ncbi:MAG: hemerythrin domain-containing protein [Burkholderiaceae bacterium]|nr:hemerythrin domain-containing protein [Burkholderiaceae bacterium]